MKSLHNQSPSRLCAADWPWRTAVFGITKKNNKKQNGVKSLNRVHLKSSLLLKIINALEKLLLKIKSNNLK